MYRNYNLNILDAARFPPHHFTSILLFKKLTQNCALKSPLLNVEPSAQNQKMSSTNMTIAPPSKEGFQTWWDSLSRHEQEQYLRLCLRPDQLQALVPAGSDKDGNDLVIEHYTHKAAAYTNVDCYIRLFSLFALFTVFFILPFFSVEDYTAHITDEKVYGTFILVLLGVQTVYLLMNQLTQDSISMNMRIHCNLITPQEINRGCFFGIPYTPLKWSFSKEFQPIINFLMLTLIVAALFMVVWTYHRLDQGLTVLFTDVRTLGYAFLENLMSAWSYTRGTFEAWMPRWQWPEYVFYPSTSTECPACTCE